MQIPFKNSCTSKTLAVHLAENQENFRRARQT